MSFELSSLSLVEFSTPETCLFMSFLVLVLNHSDLPTNFDQCQCLRNYKDPAKFHNLFLTQNPSIPKAHGIFVFILSFYQVSIHIHHRFCEGKLLMNFSDSQSVNSENSSSFECVSSEKSESFSSKTSIVALASHSADSIFRYEH